MRSWKAHGGKVRVLAFSPDGRTLATAGGTSKFVWLWDPTTGELKGKLDGHFAYVRAIAFTPDGQHLASIDNGGRVLIWANDPTAEQSVAEFISVGYQAGLLAFSPSGDRLVAGSYHQLLWWDNPLQLEPNSKPTGKLSARAGAIGYTPDGAHFLVGTSTLEIWSGDLSQQLGVIRRGYRAVARALAVSPDSSRAAIAFSTAVEIANLAERKWEHTLRSGGELVYAVGFTRDGRSLLTAGGDGQVRFWEVGTWAESRRFDWGIGRITAAAFAPDGLMCAAGAETGEIVVWDMD